MADSHKSLLQQEQEQDDHADQLHTGVLRIKEQAGLIKIIFDRAGSSNASEEDTKAFAAATLLRDGGSDMWKGMITGTKWFQSYKGGVKKGLRAIAREQPGTTFEVVCINVRHHAPCACSQNLPRDLLRL